MFKTGPVCNARHLRAETDCLGHTDSAEKAGSEKPQLRQSHRTDTQLMRQLKGQSSSRAPYYPQRWLLWQKPSIKSQATWELRQLKSQVLMGAGQREKQTEKQSANLPDFQGFPRPRPGLLDVDSQQPRRVLLGKYSNWAISQWPKEGCGCGLESFTMGRLLKWGRGATFVM